MVYLTVEKGFDGDNFNLFTTEKSLLAYTDSKPKIRIYKLEPDIAYFKIIYDYFSQEFEVEALSGKPDTYYKGPKKLKNSCYFIVKQNLLIDNYKDVIDQGKNSIKQFVLDDSIF